MARGAWVLFALALLAATGCGSTGVQFVRGTDVVPGEASHADPRPPLWAR
jgi:hypothetical protein